MFFFCVFFFFFQAEDGIRDVAVTGVQTCALPICGPALLGPGAGVARRRRRSGISGHPRRTARAGAALGRRGAPLPRPRYITRIGQAAMFTGIVTAVGTVAKATRETGLALTIRARYRGLKRGESICVNGACLTVERVVKGGFRVHVVETTRDRTLFADYARGRRVNLERALRAADRLGGHLVQGHVDGVAEVVRVEGPGGGDALVCDLRVPRGVRAVCIPQGSITVDGVSLTINALPGPDLVQVALIPFTRAHTTLGALRVGERVHVEGDLLGKYVRQLCGTER